MKKLKKVKMNKINNFYIIIIALFLIMPTITSSGLEVSSDETFEFDKKYQEDKVFEFEIKNTYNKPLYNITFEDNDYIKLNKINNLSTNETKMITATITTNKNIDKNIRIKGVYYTDLGIQNETHEVDVDFNNGLSKCDITVVKNDTVKWNNNVQDTIEIISDYGFENGKNTIDENESSKINFNTPDEEFVYSFQRRGHTFTRTCIINVIDSEGYVNNQKLDASINIKTNIQYPKTNITLSEISKNNYSLTPVDVDGGAFSITNNGNRKARNVNLKGEWFSFSENNFDLDINETKGISFEISPIITKTNKTNKTYTKQIDITGNFNNKSIDFNIFVPYTQIGDDGTYKKGKSFKDIFEEWCSNNPEKCTGGTEYIIGNKSGDHFNVTHSKEQVNEMYGLMFDTIDLMKTQNKQLKKEIISLKEDQNQTQNKIKNVNNKVNNIDDSIKTTSNTIETLVIFILSLIVCFILYKIAIKLNKTNKYHKYVSKWLKK